jgi:outer membrane protein assembly factor BamA
MVTPFQLTLGGRRSLRGLPEERFPGARRLLFTLEDRYFLRWPAPSAFDFGFTLFADAGRVWAGDVPYGVDSGWKGTVGGGIRLGFPSGTRGLVRLDLAFPIGAGDAGGPVFRVTLYELLGLATGFTDPQLARSRRLAVGPDFFTTDRR